MFKKTVGLTTEAADELLRDIGPDIKNQVTVSAFPSKFTFFTKLNNGDSITAFDVCNFQCHWFPTTTPSILFASTLPEGRYLYTPVNTKLSRDSAYLYLGRVNREPTDADIKLEDGLVEFQVKQVNDLDVKAHGNRLQTTRGYTYDTEFTSAERLVDSSGEDDLVPTLHIKRHPDMTNVDYSDVSLTQVPMNYSDEPWVNTIQANHVDIVPLMRYTVRISGYCYGSLNSLDKDLVEDLILHMYSTLKIHEGDVEFISTDNKVTFLGELDLADEGYTSDQRSVAVYSVDNTPIYVVQLASIF